MKQVDRELPGRHEQHIQRFHRTLSEHGYRLTRARRHIVRALVASDGHLSADALAGLVRREGSGVGRMTVYRTLDLLAELGLIRPVYQGTGAAHYILLADGHHHHLICSRCDHVIEFDDCAWQELGRQVGARFDFAVQGHLLEIYGLCAACQA